MVCYTGSAFTVTAVKVKAILPGMFSNYLKIQPNFTFYTTLDYNALAFYNHISLYWV